MRVKRKHEMSVRTTVSMPPVVFDWGVEGMKGRGNSSFSNYVAELIKDDKKQRQQLMLQLR